MRFCVDCKYYEGYEAGPDGKWWEQCNYPIAPVYDLVSGKQTNLYAKRIPFKERYEADNVNFDRCGAGGRRFEQRATE